VDHRSWPAISACVRRGQDTNSLHVGGQIRAVPWAAVFGHGLVSATDECLFLQLTFQDLDFLGQRHVVADQALDLAHRVQNRRVVATAEAPANFRQ
jgi:hypothetical protein